MRRGRITNRRRSFGNAVISRWPIARARGHLLPKTQLVDRFDLQRGFRRGGDRYAVGTAPRLQRTLSAMSACSSGCRRFAP